MYLNDLEEYLLDKNCQLLLVFDAPRPDFYLKLLVLMYADDTVIMGQSEQGLHQVLRVLEKYCTQWKLDINCNKTNVIVFGTGRHTVD